MLHHRFDGEALAKSYSDLARRGHLRGTGAEGIARAFDGWANQDRVPGIVELRKMVDKLPTLERTARTSFRGDEVPMPDYAKLVLVHNARRSRAR